MLFVIDGANVEGETSMTRHGTLFVAIAIAICLATGCSQQPGSTTGAQADSAETASEEQVEAAAAEATETPSETPAKPGTDEQIAVLAGSWKAVGLLYENKAYLFSDYPTLSDLYTNYYITFYEDGRFAFQENVFIVRGTWQYYNEDDSITYYLLKTDSVARVTLESGLGGEATEVSEGDVYLAYVVGDAPFVVLHEQGDDLSETPLPVYATTNAYQVPKEASSVAPSTNTGETAESTGAGKDTTQGDTSSSSPSPPPQRTQQQQQPSQQHNATPGENRAVQTAESYIEMMGFSREGLIEQLEYEGFSHSEAVYGADHINADWNSMALRKAWEYLRVAAFSRSGLIEQLEFEGFTHEQAVFGVDNCGADWREQAVKKAREYQDILSLSGSSLIEQLEFEGFTHDEAVYGASNA